MNILNKEEYFFFISIDFLPILKLILSCQLYKSILNYKVVSNVSGLFILDPNSEH